MSKQYKLKKSFPTLPSDWEVGMILGQGDRGDFGDYSPCAGNYTAVYLSPQIVEKSKEYFEEVPVPVVSEKVKESEPEAKYMSSLQAYTEGFAQGVKHCERYGIPLKPFEKITMFEGNKKVYGFETEQPTNDNAFWTDELVAEFAMYWRDGVALYGKEYVPQSIEVFKSRQSKQSEPLPSDTVSKEWEIVSYIGNSTKMIYTLVNDEWCPPDGYVPFPNNKQGIEQSGCEIHSVKRLSDKK